MKKIKMEIELEYDDEHMHNKNRDKEAKQWFYNDVLWNPCKEEGLILHSNQFGETVGTIKVLSITQRGKTIRREQWRTEI